MKLFRSPAEGDGSAAEAEGGVEHMLLVALTALYTDERETDVRLGVLRVAINVLQRHGARQNALFRVKSSQGASRL